jgi:hypothetical protein
MHTGQSETCELSEVHILNLFIYNFNFILHIFVNCKLGRIHEAYFPIILASVINQAPHHGRVAVKFCAFLTMTLDGDEWSSSSLAVLCLGKRERDEKTRCGCHKSKS